MNNHRNSVSSCDSSSGSGSIQSESFYLHNPGEVIYNRVKDLFETDSGKQQTQQNQQQQSIQSQQNNSNNLSALTEATHNLTKNCCTYFLILSGTSTEYSGRV
ncbi:putative espin isoform X1 [Trypoxylus dichotomus]